LNISWFCRCFYKDPPTLIININKALFAISFVVVRIIFGLYWTSLFFKDAWAYLSAPDAQPHKQSLIYLFSAGLIFLNGLNIHWFIKILSWVEKKN